MADVFLLPSELESFGLSALEAMALRRAGGRLRRGRPARGRQARRDRLPAARGRHRGHGRAHDRDPEGRRAPPRAWARPAAAAPTSLFGADRVVSQYERFYEKVLGLMSVTMDAFDIAGDLRAPRRRRAGHGRHAGARECSARPARRAGGPHARRVRQPRHARDAGGRGARGARGSWASPTASRSACPTRGLAPVPEQKDAVVAALRRLRPRVVLAAALGAAPPRPRRGQPHRLRRLVPGRPRELPARSGRRPSGRASSSTR